MMLYNVFLVGSVVYINIFNIIKELHNRDVIH